MVHAKQSTNAQVKNENDVETYARVRVRRSVTQMYNALGIPGRLPDAYRDADLHAL